MALWPSFGSVGHAAVRIENVEMPFYARYVVGDEWTAVVFYRPQACIPPDFNLVGFYDIPGAFGCGPMTVNGFAVFANDPRTDLGPVQAKFKDDGPVPIWLLPTERFAPARADGVLTVGELEALHPLRATADSYSEVLHANRDEPFHYSAVAAGTLADGRPFSLRAVRTLSLGVVRVDVRIG
jgi:hypothetical protein